MPFRKARPLFALSAILLTACAANPAAPVADEVVITPEPPPAPVYVLDDVLGATPAAIDEMLGPPALARKEGQGEFRRYGLRECALIVILYPDETGFNRAAHVEATALTSGQEKPDLEACLAEG
ncbi:MAG: hypothetical protein AAGD92_11650 [Pseudomonadota bacterium]